MQTLSSHHFINGEKLTALIIANGQECSQSLITQMMEWNPFILALDGAANRLAEKQIKFDALLGDFDSLDASTIFIEPFEKIEVKNQNKTDFEKGIEYLIDKGFKSINILWATGKRADHTLNNILSICKYPEISISIYNNNSCIFIAKSGFSKWYKEGTNLSYFGIPEATKLSISNLEYPIDNISLFTPSSSSSNRAAANGLVEIKYESGILVVMECWD